MKEKDWEKQKLGDMKEYTGITLYIEAFPESYRRKGRYLNI